jgi:hypothetical protein
VLAACGNVCIAPPRPIYIPVRLVPVCESFVATGWRALEPHAWVRVRVRLTLTLTLTTPRLNLEECEG